MKILKYAWIPALVGLGVLAVVSREVDDESRHNAFARQNPPIILPAEFDDATQELKGRLDDLEARARRLGDELFGLRYDLEQQVAELEKRTKALTRELGELTYAQNRLAKQSNYAFAVLFDVADKVKRNSRYLGFQGLDLYNPIVKRSLGL